MSEVIGRAGGNVRHLQHRGTKGTGGTRADRASLLHESMRDLDPAAAKTHAAINPNIVLAETHLNVAMVNDGQGGFRRPTSTKEVLDYGDDRIANVYRKWSDKSFETTLIVVHLPKTMCEEIPDFYPVLDKDTGEPVLSPLGTPQMRSRWVAKDRQKALEYFNEVVTYYGGAVLTGGQAAIHGYDINFDESTPHIQMMADTLAPDPNPKHPGKLRVEASQMWGAHREVTVVKVDKTTGQPVVDTATGEAVRVMEQPKAKMSRYQEGLREHMYDLGYPVELDYDPERHLTGSGKDEYAEIMDAQREVQERGVSVRTREVNVRIAENELQVERVQVSDWRDDIREQDYELRGDRRLHGEREKALNEREGVLDRLEAQLPRRRAEAVDEGRKEGLRQARVEAERIIARARAQRAELTAQARQVTERLFNDFLDRKSPNGVTLRTHFERFVDQQLAAFEREHDVVDDLELNPGDREAFIADGGTRLAAEVVGLKRERSLGS